MIGLVLLAVATQGPAIPKHVVTVLDPGEVRIVAGEKAETQVTVTIARGFRIQANPATEPFLIPATLELTADERVRVGPIQYPPGEPYRLRGADSELSIYGETLTIRVPLEAPPTSAQESVRVVLEGTLRYQACNQVVCLRPTSVPVRLPVRIEPGGGSRRP
jgi:thiol:disulfide interchange protein DsbD